MAPSPGLTHRPTQTRWVICGLACAVSWLLYVHRYAWSVVRADVKKENNLTDVELGWLDSLFQIPYALGQVPGGLAGDLLGARLVLPVMILAWSGCIAAIALVMGPWLLASVRLLFGASQAGTYPVLSKVTKTWFPPAARTTVQGMVASFSGRAGAACAPILMATVMMAGLGLSWRSALVSLAALGLLVAVTFWLLYRNSPREHTWVNAREAELIEAGEMPATTGTRPRLSLGGARTWTLVAMAVYSFASTFADQLFVSWLPQFLEEEKGLQKGELGVYASLPLWGGALGGAVGGLLNDVLIRSLGNRRLARQIVAMTGKVLAGLIIALSVFVSDGRWIMAVLFACKFFNDWSLSTLWGTITDVAGRASGTVFGMVNMVGSCGGFVAGPILGYLKASHGWDVVFFAVGGVFVFAGLCWVVIDCTQRIVAD